LRVMAPCFAMGEAAGLAAARVVNDDIAFRDVQVKELRNDLRRYGAVVDWA